MLDLQAPPSNPKDIWRRYDEAEQRLAAGVSERMLDLAGLRRGQRVLDIATGRGEPALRAARRVGPDGFVLGTDRSADMLALARERAAAEGIANLGLEAAAAETLAGVPDDSFDAALCRWGLMYVDRPRAALAAARRCLRPASVFVIAAWGEPALTPWWSMPRDVLARHAPVAPIDPAAPGPFRYAHAAPLHADLASAGFAVEHEEACTTAVMEAATPDELMAWCLTFGLATLLREQPPSVVDAWQRDMAAEAERYRDTDGWYRLSGVTRLVVARAPGA